jgi:predicted TIM-barrel fold metal-dependent hydrolase
MRSFSTIIFLTQLNKLKQDKELWLFWVYPSVLRDVYVEMPIVKMICEHCGYGWKQHLTS